MRVSGKGASILGRRRGVSTGAASGFELQKALRILVRPGTWLICVLFFVAATPFELKYSGITYLLKACAMLGIVGYAILVQRARTGRLSLLAITVVVVLFVTNLLGWSDRVLLAMAAIVAGTLLGQARGNKWNDEFQVVVFVYLIVHSVGLLVATLIFYSTGQVIELHSAIFPHDSRSEAYGDVGRLSGFHNEPGTYSQWMIMALYLFALTNGKLYNKWISVIVVSVVLTFSLWGVLAFAVIAVAFIIEVLMAPGKGQRIRGLLSLILFVVIITTLALNASGNIVEQGLDFLDRKGGTNSQSGLDKLHAMEFMRQEFWGVVVLGRPFDPGFAPQCISPQDSGLGMTGTYYLGFLLFASLIIVFAIRVYSYWGFSFVVPIALVLVWKAHIYEPVFWVIIGYVLKGPGKIKVGRNQNRSWRAQR